MLQHRECNAPAEVDPAKPPLINGGTEIWYHIRCSACWRHLGILADVESPKTRFTQTELALENDWRRSH
jgi:hypothetical protein